MFSRIVAYKNGWYILTKFHLFLPNLLMKYLEFTIFQSKFLSYTFFVLKKFLLITFFNEKSLLGSKVLISLGKPANPASQAVIFLEIF